MKSKISIQKMSLHQGMSEINTRINTDVLVGFCIFINLVPTCLESSLIGSLGDIYFQDKLVHLTCCSDNVPQIIVFSVNKLVSNCCLI